MANFFCEYCGKETKFLSISAIQKVADVCRSTVYYWMDRAWIHWRELPSGRRIICQESLSHQARQLNSGDEEPGSISLKLSKTVENRVVR